MSKHILVFTTAITEADNPGHHPCSDKDFRFALLLGTLVGYDLLHPPDKTGDFKVKRPFRQVRGTAAGHYIWRITWQD